MAQQALDLDGTEGVEDPLSEFEDLSREDRAELSTRLAGLDSQRQRGELIPWSIVRAEMEQEEQVWVARQV